jgi:hypothetical protein
LTRNVEPPPAVLQRSLFEATTQSISSAAARLFTLPQLELATTTDHARQPRSCNGENGRYARESSVIDTPHPASIWSDGVDGAFLPEFLLRTSRTPEQRLYAGWIRACRIQKKMGTGTNWVLKSVTEP